MIPENINAYLSLMNQYSKKTIGNQEIKNALNKLTENIAKDNDPILFHNADENILYVMNNYHQGTKIIGITKNQEKNKRLQELNSNIELITENEFLKLDNIKISGAYIGFGNEINVKILQKYKEIMETNTYITIFKLPQEKNFKIDILKKSELQRPKNVQYSFTKEANNIDFNFLVTPEN
ncbi:hypothetical protein K9L67_00680 [Candidatus Woesearchaeota archaeon]|nr:hypothetical protein [Candidatus Woesearchaeota archaeon]MCF7900722.1 hypothetical protein [Candidatus Woesearchaeota archaeon]MCF8013243.1 hypothetical protein [Candidatus Woesearchaeota archaeon]